MIHLPKTEYYFFRYILGPVYFKLISRKRTLDSFIQLTREVLNTYEQFDNKDQKIKIKRIRGIEESSTNWSPNELLEHLVIVNKACLRIISELETNPNFTIQISTADVKPTGKISNPKAILESFLLEYQNKFTQLEFNSKSTVKHPWFGKMNSSDWHKLLGLHTLVHLTQIQVMFKVK